MQSKFGFETLRGSLNQSTLRILYYRYRHKEYVLPVIAIFISFMLFVFVIIPQVQDFSTIRAREDAVQKKVAAMEKNISFLSNTSETQLDAQLGQVSRALPPEKDFSGILFAVSLAAGRAKVGLGDFSFQIGNISGGQEVAVDNYPTTDITLQITGGIEGAKRFLLELANSTPLSEIISLRVEGDTAIMTVSFYYRPLPKLSFDNNHELIPLSSKEQAIVDKISLLQNSSL